jgi:hypothetical protein
MLVYSKDPVLWLLAQRLKLPWAVIPILATVLVAALNFGFGSFVSYAVHQGDNFIRIFDPENLYYNLVADFTSWPLLWLMYVRQPQVIATALDSLYRNRIFACSDGEQLHSFTDKIRARIDSRLVLALAVLSALSWNLFNVLVVLPAGSQRLGREFFYLHDKYYFVAVYLPITFLSVYVGSTLIWKSVVTAFMFHKLFRQLGVNVHPLHPDQAGGLGSVGSVAINHGLIAVIFAEIVSLTAVRIMLGSGWQWRDLIFFSVLYLLITPLVVVGTLWTAHCRMVQIRDQLLQDISEKFEKKLVHQGPEGITVSRDQVRNLGDLKKMHDLVEETYPTWPISAGAFRKFSLTTLAPIITVIAPIVVNLLH